MNQIEHGRPSRPLRFFTRFVGVLALVAVSSALVVISPRPALAATMRVNSLNDANDNSAGDGQCYTGVLVPGDFGPVKECTLRAAIQEANATSAGDTITFRVGGTITLNSTLGQLTIRNTAADPDVTIQGPGANVLTVSGNNATIVFGVIEGAVATISGLTIADGRGWASAGIYNAAATRLTLTDSVVTRNTVIDNGNLHVFGGGIQNHGTMTVTRSTISANMAVCGCWVGKFAYGGGISNTGRMTITDSSVSGNTADFGGGIYNAMYAELHLTGSTIDGNVAMRRDGGGIHNADGSYLWITNSTVTNNEGRDAHVVGYSGGIFNGGWIQAINSTLYGNTGADVGAPNPNSQFRVGNSIVGVVEGAVNSYGHNLTYAADGGPAWSETDILVSNAFLRIGALASNGGPTRTRAPLPRSRAIDAAKADLCPPTDQRGLPRPKDGDGNGTATCDIGAFERQVPPPAPPSAPDLASASDTGASDTDNVTNDATPTVIGTADPGATVKIWTMGKYPSPAVPIVIGEAIATTDGAYRVTTDLPETTHRLWASAETADAGTMVDSADTLRVVVDVTPPTFDLPPAHQFPSATRLATGRSPGTVPVRLAWQAASDPGSAASGLWQYKLQRSVNDGPFSAVSLESPTAIATTAQLVPGGDTYLFRAWAVDVAGNASGRRAGEDFRVRAFQESSSVLRDVGTWATGRVTGAYGGSVQYASRAGRKTTFRVPSGAKNVALVSTVGPDRGEARICFDPGTAAEVCTIVDLYAPAQRSRSVVFAAAVPPGTGTVGTTVLGTKDRSSTGTRVDVDAILTTT
jgi:CSLREA domain-containing protein